MRKINILGLITLSFALLITFNKPVSAEPIDNVGTWSYGSKFISALTQSEGENMGQLTNKFVTGIGDIALGYTCPECTVSNPLIQQADIPESMKYGLVGIVENQVIAMFESQPRVDVIAHLSEEWVPGYEESKSVYASGYDDLQKTGISSLWSASRNIAYLGFVIVMILIGFMIMFRSKLGGQTLVTMGNTLPRVIVSLVLVTFSYAIIGIIIDLAGVLMKVIASDSILGSGVPVHNIFQLLSGVLGIGGGITVGTLGLGGIALLFTPIVGKVVGIIAIIITLIILFIIIKGAIKLWFTLLKSYLSILVNVIVAPIAIMMGALPGNDAVIINLFKSVLRNALVFPVAFAIVNIPYFIADQQQIVIGFPETITGSTGNIDKVGPIIIGVAKIIAIYVAAETPVLMQSIIPATASKSGADASAAIKAGLGKVPLIGGMFGAK